MKEESKKTKDAAAQKRMPDLQQGAYSDGHPLDEVHYLECKIILKGDRFTSVQNFHDFSKIVRATAEASEVAYSTEAFKGLRPQIREVLIGSFRLLCSHNAQFPLSRVHEADRTSMKTLARVFPVLETIKTSDTDKVELVNATAVEEAPGHRNAGLRQGNNSQGERGGLADARRSETARRRVRISMQVQAPRRIPRCRQETLRAILLLTATKR
ncbi:MAG: hypothetical protein WCD63_10740 [Terrimicrobiaceae bacterium]